MSSYLEIAVKAATAAGDLLKEKMGGPQQVHYKGRINLVTEMDRRSEELIISTLSREFPGHQFLTEEGASQGTPSSHKWIIDPLDGTTNYAHGFPVFAVSIALEVEGEVVAGVVYNPNLEELFTAERGKGAFKNGVRLNVSSTSELERSLLATGFPYDVREAPDNNLKYFSRFLTRAQAIRRAGSASLDLAYVAAGIFDGFWEIKLYPWDVAAGALLVSEAGGRVSDFRGRPIDIYGKEALASNGKIHSQMMAVLEAP